MEKAQKIFAGFLALLGVAWLIQGFTVEGIIILIAATITWPKILNSILSLFGKEVNQWKNISIKTGVIIIGIIVAIISQNIDSSEGDKLVNQAEKAIENKNLEQAIIFINKAKEEYRNPDNKAVKLESMFNNLNSDKFLKETLISFSDEEFQKLKSNKLSVNLFDNSTLNDILIAKLQENVETRNKYINEKLIQIADSNIGQYLMNIIIQLPENKYIELKSKVLDTTIIKEYPPVNSLLITKLEEVANKREEYLKIKLTEIADNNLDFYLMTKIGELSDEQFNQLKKGELEAELVKTPSLNSYLITEMTKNISLREKYFKYQAQLERNKKIESQFSSWDGSHQKLENFIEKNMKDPDSYEHVKTTYSDKGGYLLVKTTYRGKNSFGAKVLNSVTAKVSMDGQILKIISQN